MQILTRTVFTIVALFACAGTALAANLVTNPEIDNGTSSWRTDQGGSLSVDSGHGSPAAPALKLTLTTGALHASAISDCIPVQAGQAYDLTVNARFLTAYNPSPSVIASAHYYSDTNCATSVTYGSGSSGVNAQWKELAVTNALMPTGVASVRVDLKLSRAPGMPENLSVLFDHVFFGLAGTTPVTLQSFQVR